MSEQLKEAFSNPDAAWRGKPFWSWNGKLEKGELFRQIQVIREMGMGGFFMHSRTGLATEYLGDEWFELINNCADEGERLGLEAWLYDEDRWPSGIAGGKVTQHPEFRQRSIFLQVSDAPVEEEDIIAQWTAKLDGVHCTDLAPYQGGTVPPAKKLLTFRIVEQEKNSFFNGYTYLDTLNREATARFLEVTHEQYRKRCGQRIGRSIKGMFTDEPNRGSLMTGLLVGKQYGSWTVPYTLKLFGEFEKRFGYDLVARLPELFLQVDGQRVSPVKWQFAELLMQLFLENFMRPCNEWCDEHQLPLTGHVLHEDDLTAQTAMCGSVMRCYEQMRYPGVDVLTENNRQYWVVKQVQSVARQLGQEWLLSELYGCTGWQMTFAGHKAAGDWQALFGINVRCHHLSWYTMRGESKRDYPGSIFYQSAWWPDYAAVETYFARTGLLMSQGHAVCDLLVIHPVESVWAQVHAGWAEDWETRSPQVTRLNRIHAELFHLLQGAQIDFDYGDEEMLARLGRIGDGRLQLGQARYRAVLVAGMDTIRASTLKRLREFAEAGGTVVFAGDPPAYVDAAPSDAAVKLAQESVQTGLNRDALASVFDSPLRLYAADGAAFVPVFVQMRESDDGAKTVMLLNTDRERGQQGLRVEMDASGTLVEWDCRTGEHFRVPASEQDGRMSFTLDLEPGGAVVLRTGDEDADCLRLRPRYRTHNSVAMDGPFRYRLGEPNVCVLDRAQWRIDDGEWHPAEEILRVDRAVRRTVGLPLRSGEMLQPWFSAQHEAEDKGRVALRFTFSIEQMPRSAIELAIEEPERFEIVLNGQRLCPATECGFWVDPAFRRIAVPASALRPGCNELVLETDFTEQSNLEALYLLGGFGVRADGTGVALIDLPEQLAVGDLTKQGLPFYGASVVYEIPLPDKAGQEHLFLRMPEMGAVCAKVRVPGGPETLVPWHPYEAEITQADGSTKTVELELVLSRRNTFGPLHELPLQVDWNGPGNFVTEGEHFSEAPALTPTGLLVAPVWETRASLEQ